MKLHRSRCGCAKDSGSDFAQAFPERSFVIFYCAGNNAAFYRESGIVLSAASVSANGGWIGRLMPGAAKAGFRCFKYAVLSIYLWRCMEGGFMFTHQEKVKERRFFRDTFESIWNFGPARPGRLSLPFRRLPWGITSFISAGRFCVMKPIRSN